ncbi:uncharacterized protein [Branchiostoma lanceolatum]|uniref:uncharacterized protein isoform X3 n=1 Tax=Branchiostoma lanceolatum TaxID=7740 RepID=UPI0034569AF6
MARFRRRSLPSRKPKKLDGEDGMRVKDLVADAILEYRLTDYRVTMSSTRAILNPDANALMLRGEDILIEDLTSQIAAIDPRLAGDARFRVVHELMVTERNYIDALKSIFDIYAEPLRKFSSLSPEDYKVLFSGLEPLLSLSRTLYKKLEDSVPTWDTDHTAVGNIFSKQLWSQYDEYYMSYKETRMLLRQKRETDEEFLEFCNIRRGAARHSIDSLLLLPVQRVPQYNKILSDLLKETPSDHPDFDDLTKAANRVQKMVTEREEEVNFAENEMKMMQVQERFPHDDLALYEREKLSKPRSRLMRRKSAPAHVIQGHLTGGGRKISSSGSLLSPSSLPSSGRVSPVETSPVSRQRLGTNNNAINRQYIMEGPVQLTQALQTQDRYLFLFSDIVLVAKPKSANTFKLKHRVRLSEMWLATCLDEVCETTKTLDKSFVIGWPTTNTVATFSTPELKELWWDALMKLIAEGKSKEEPKSVTLKVENRDIECPAYSKSFSVSNTDSASNVVKMSLQQFGITDDASNYRLWVKSGKDEAPYPLIGHEIPFAIKMSHLRDAAVTAGDDHLVLLDQEIMPSMDHLSPETQVQFVLRDSRKTKIVMEDIPSKKLKRFKKSPIINWPFKRTSSKSDMPDSPSSSEARGKLFGHPLEKVCVDGQLPRPILDLLTCLFQNGPYVTGIFRKSANARCCRELKEKLDKEAEYNLSECPIHAVAAVFKDFLRNLPHSILHSDLYQDWVACNTEQNISAKVTIVRRILDQLPSGNLTLLRYFVCILHHISLKSDENNMTAYNLAICIAPSMLNPPLEACGDIQAAATKQVPEVVQLLIEHCKEIFGADITTIMGEAPQDPDHKLRQDSSGDSDSVNSMQDCTGVMRRDDSSLDSLERELYISEMESSPRTQHGDQFSPSSLSRDSGLTLSDTNLYHPEEEHAGSSDKSRYDAKYQHERCNSDSSQHQMSSVLDNMSLGSSSGYSSLSHDSTPIPPPRRNRRKSEPPPPPAKLLRMRKNSDERIIPEYIKQIKQLQIESQKMISETEVYSPEKDTVPHRRVTVTGAVDRPNTLDLFRDVRKNSNSSDLSPSSDSVFSGSENNSRRSSDASLQRALGNLVTVSPRVSDSHGPPAPPPRKEVSAEAVRLNIALGLHNKRPSTDYGVHVAYSRPHTATPPAPKAEEGPYFASSPSKMSSRQAETPPKSSPTLAARPTPASSLTNLRKGPHALLRSKSSGTLITTGLEMSLESLTSSDSNLQVFHARSSSESDTLDERPSALRQRTFTSPNPLDLKEPKVTAEQVFEVVDRKKPNLPPSYQEAVSRSRQYPISSGMQGLTVQTVKTMRMQRQDKTIETPNEPVWKKQSETVWEKQSSESGRNKRPSEPVRSTKQPTEPVRSTKQPTEPVRSTKQPTEPVRSTKQPTEPVRSTKQPTEPVRSTKQPTEPVRSTKQPTEPVRSTKQPTEPVRSTKQPTEPVRSTKQPIEPAKNKQQPEPVWEKQSSVQQKEVKLDEENTTNGTKSSDILSRLQRGVNLTRSNSDSVDHTRPSVYGIGGKASTSSKLFQDSVPRKAMPISKIEVNPEQKPVCSLRRTSSELDRTIAVHRQHFQLRRQQLFYGHNSPMKPMRKEMDIPVTDTSLDRQRRGSAPETQQNKDSLTESKVVRSSCPSKLLSSTSKAVPESPGGISSYDIVQAMTSANFLSVQRGQSKRQNSQESLKNDHAQSEASSSTGTKFQFPFPDPKSDPPTSMLSPEVKNTVKDYFLSSDPINGLKRSKETVSEITKTKQDWNQRKRGNLDFADLDQMMFAEESYV